jgi:ATP-binding cassette, subfamily B, bacterial PglK
MYFHKKIYNILDNKEKKKFIFLILFLFLVAIIEVIGIASIMPFIAVVSNPQIIHENKFLFFMYNFFKVTSVNNFLIILGIFIFTVILMSNVIKLSALYFQLNFIQINLYKISKSLFIKYLHEPYSFFLNQNTSILGKDILSESSQYAHNVLGPFTQIISKGILIFFVLLLLLLVDPILAVIIISVLGGTYLVLYFIIQNKLYLLGKERFESNAIRFKISSETFGGIKEIKVLGREKFFADYFSHHARKIEFNNIKSGLIGAFPIYFMEVLAFGGLVIIILYFLLMSRDVSLALPIIVLYAFAGYRMMPALQGIFSSISLLRFNLKVLDYMYDELSVVPNDCHAVDNCVNKSTLSLHKQVELQSVTFFYPGTNVPVIDDLSMIIPKSSYIGLVGATGSGKTTLVDIILGLFIPQKGSIVIDGKMLAMQMIPNWQRNIGYVPQSIFLTDDSLINNIAFGVPTKEVDFDMVERAAKLANIHDFIVKELPYGYTTIVGERGVRLSGGQRQRIGIARALYRDPELLIMDEATSALDGITEDLVIKSLRDLAGNKTIITIAHRLTTLKECDNIYILDKGKCIVNGTYNTLIYSSDTFQNMANIIK